MATFPGFTSVATPYKKVGDHEILAGILIPEELSAGKHPVIVRFHGGFLVGVPFVPSRFCYGCAYQVRPQFTGGHTAFFQPWLQEYAKIHSAVVVSADYRLMPEHNGLDMMEDLKDLWHWIFNELQSFVGDKADLDMDKILIEGDSAGSFCPGNLLSLFSFQLTRRHKGAISRYSLLYHSAQRFEE